MVSMATTSRSQSFDFGTEDEPFDSVSRLFVVVDFCRFCRFDSGVDFTLAVDFLLRDCFRGGGDGRPPIDS